MRRCGDYGILIIVLIALLAGCSTQMKIPTIQARNISRVAALPITELEYVASQGLMPTYTQRLVIHSDRELSDKDFGFHPLLGGKELAFTSRWDDNSEVDFSMKELLSSYGVKGTFYLNAPYFSHATGSYSSAEDFTPQGRELYSEGFTIGSHALSHPFITMTNRNRMFTELMETRILWEAATDKPVISHAFSFTDFRNDYEGDYVQRDLYLSMERSGLYHTPNQNAYTSLPSDIEFSPILPPDGLGDIQLGYDWMITDEKMLKAAPVISLSMHSWGYDEEDLKMLKRFLDGIVGKEELWHCSQNEYAAYRRAVKNSQIISFESSVSEDQRRPYTYSITLERPIVAALNSNTALSMWVAQPADLQVELEGELLDVYLVADRPSFDLAPTSEQRLPQQISYLNEEEGTAVDITLEIVKDQIQVTVSNGTDYPLRSLDGVLRLPLAFEQGTTWFSIETLEAHGSKTLTLPVDRKEDIIYQAGILQAVFQLDLDEGIDGQRVRYYRSLFVPEDPQTTSRTLLANASILGPLPWDFEARSIERMYRYSLADTSSLEASAWTFGTDGPTIPWRRISSSLLTDYPYLGPDYVPIRPNYFGVGMDAYLVKVSLYSETDQLVDIVCDPEAVEHLFVNGTETGFFRVPLNKGTNSLLWYHRNPLQRGLTYASVGSYLKIERPLSDDRVEGLVFQPVEEGQDRFLVDLEKIEWIQDRAGR